MVTQRLTYTVTVEVRNTKGVQWNAERIAGALLDMPACESADVYSAKYDTGVYRRRDRAGDEK